MPYPSQLCLHNRFGESPCQTQEDNKCRVPCGPCGTTSCNKCIEPFAKKLCLLSGKKVKCGCSCSGKNKCNNARKCKAKCKKRALVVDGCKGCRRH